MGIRILLIVFLLLPAAVKASENSSVRLPDTLHIKNICIANSPQKPHEGKALYDYINGGADVYFDFGFKTCYARNYSSLSDKESDIVVNVYDMGKSLHAFGLFRKMADGDSIARGVGAEYVKRDRDIYYWMDRYFVEIIDKSAKQVGHYQKLGKIISRSIRGTKDFPAELKWLPEIYRVQGSMRFHKEYFLSRSFLKNVCSAEYREEAIGGTLFILKADSSEEAIGIFKKLSDLYKESKSVDENNELSSYDNIMSDKILAIRNGDKITGMVGRCAFDFKTDLILESLDLQK
jgi:hypothetical protein